jgi:1-aminocyclopropane-1-carboxylate deaminase/D-cysteine desulfhydrase-like pyridoxal-dependent ACC family enzyme
VVPLAAVSYTLCVAEIAEQVAGMDLKPDALYVSSAGATGAGVALGKSLLGWRCPARLICPMHWLWHIPTRMADDANAAAERMGLPHRIAASDLDADEGHVAPGYGLPSPGGREAMHLLATTEAILLDHVYTSKAMAALIADVRAGKFPPGSVLIFIHTGGVPAIFAEPVAVLPGM